MVGKRHIKSSKYLNTGPLKIDSLSTVFDTQANLSYMKIENEIEDSYYKNDY